MELALRDLERVTGGGASLPPALLKTADRVLFVGAPAAAAAGLATYFSVKHYLREHVNGLLDAAHQRGREER